MAFKDKIRWVVQSITGDSKEENEEHTDTKQVLLDAAKHLKHGMKLGEKIAIEDAVNLQHITGVAMGGSMHPLFIMQTYLQNQGYNKPIQIIRDYTIPSFVSKKGFLIVVSYSGNTEETISAYRQAYREGYRMIVMASGGKLKDIATKHGTTMVELPPNYQPRHSFYFMFGALLQIFANSGIITDLNKETEYIDNILRKPMFETMGKQLAEKLDNKIPIIYTSEKLGRIAERWKICFTENAKVHAFHNIIPELDHNELNAYVTKHGPFHTLFLVDEKETEKHLKRIHVTKQIIKEKGYDATEILIRGPTYLSRMLSAIYIGDWVSYHCAMRAGIDPASVEVVERFKKLLND